MSGTDSDLDLFEDDGSSCFSNKNSSEKLPELPLNASFFPRQNICPGGVPTNVLCTQVQSEHSNDLNLPPADLDDVPFLERWLLRALAEETFDATKALEIIGKDLLPRHANSERRALRPGQAEVVLSVLRGSSTLALFPTGYGKSLCYQLVAYTLKLLAPYRSLDASRVVVVVSPLIALLQDQLMSIKQAGVLDACCITSKSSSDVQKEILGQLATSKEYRMSTGSLHDDCTCAIDVLFVSPERFVENFEFLDAFGRSGKALKRVAALCIDEAHCICEWSHDFRPTYLAVAQRLRDLADAAGCLPPPILALTATATPAMISQLSASLRLRKIVERHDPRANLSCRIFQKADIIQHPMVATDCEKNCAARDITNESLDERHAQEAVLTVLLETQLPAIVYVGTQQQSEVLAEFLRRRLEGKESAKTSSTIPFVVRSYHGGMDTSMRRTIQHQFQVNQVTLLVATVAFGMGIDKPDIRTVVHAETPGNLLAYVQEAGRAGRDGEPADCVIVHGGPRQFFDHQRRLVANLVAPCDVQSVVSQIISASSASCYSIEEWEDRYFSVESVAAEINISPEAVSGILYQLVVHHPDAVRIEAISPQSIRISQMEGVQSKYTGSLRCRGKRRRGGVAGETAGAGAGNESEILNFLQQQDPVFDFCAKAFVSNNGDIRNVLDASMTLNIGREKFVRHVKELNASGRLRATFRRYSHVLKVSRSVLGSTEHVWAFSRSIIQRQNKRLAENMASLRSTFSFFEMIAKSEHRQYPLTSSIVQDQKSEWAIPKPPFSPAQAMEIVHALHRACESSEDSVPSIRSAITATQLLLGSPPPRGADGLGASAWLRCPYRGKLRMMDFKWVLDACQVAWGKSSI